MLPVAMAISKFQGFRDAIILPYIAMIDELCNAELEGVAAQSKVKVHDAESSSKAYCPRWHRGPCYRGAIFQSVIS